MIKQFRMVWHNEACEVCGPDDNGDDHNEFGPRSSGKVARWALGRAAGILQQQARTALRIGKGEESPMTPHEHSLSLVLERLAEGDRESARSHAEWLVKPHAREHLLRALDPLATGPARLLPTG